MHIFVIFGLFHTIMAASSSSPEQFGFVRVPTTNTFVYETIIQVLPTMKAKLVSTIINLEHAEENHAAAIAMEIWKCLYGENEIHVVMESVRAAIVKQAYSAGVYPDMNINKKAEWIGKVPFSNSDTTAVKWTRAIANPVISDVSNDVFILQHKHHPNIFSEWIFYESYLYALEHTRFDPGMDMVVFSDEHGRCGQNGSDWRVPSTPHNLSLQERYYLDLEDDLFSGCLN